MPDREAEVWLRLPFTPESAGEARRMLETWIAEHAGGLCVREDWLEDARLVLSELIGNAVRHAAPLPDGTVEVGWAPLDTGINISVRDGGGSAVPQVREAPPMATSGRGMAIVEALAQRWWVDRSAGLTTTHALIS